MSLNDPLSNALSKIMNTEQIGKKKCIIFPVSKVIKKVLEVMNDNKYIGTFNEIKDSKGNSIEVNLLGNINKCGAIRPTYPINVDLFEKFEKRYLPAKDFGIIIMSTTAGIITHNEAKKKKIGGKLLAYCY